jgi:hypothetical protein
VSPCHGERVTAQVVTVKLDQVKGVEEDARVVVSIADAVEARDTVIAARHRLAVDDAGARAQLGKGLDDARETVSQVVARPAVELHPRALLAGDHTEASCLISCNHSSPEGACGAELGRHGAMNPAGRVRGCESMGGG